MFHHPLVLLHIPPDDDELIGPQSGVLLPSGGEDYSELYVLCLMFIQPYTTPLMFDTLLPFSSENDDKVFNHGILASNEENSPYLLSHRAFNHSKIISDFSKSPMMIFGGDISYPRMFRSPFYLP
ncbi:hypothetical protein Tco_0266888 [Tanacetum coccineum]